MGNNTFDTLQFGISRCYCIGQYKLRIKNIQTLIFHGAHIEMTHSNNVVLIKVVFQVINRFIPSHRSFQRCHRMPGEGLIASLDVKP